MKIRRKKNKSNKGKLDNFILLYKAKGGDA